MAKLQEAADLGAPQKHPQEIRLTRTQFDILALLACNAGCVVPSRMPLQQVWGPDYGDDTRTLRVHLGHLRKRIERQSFALCYILTEPGIGYRVGSSPDAHRDFMSAARFFTGFSQDFYYTLSANGDAMNLTRLLQELHAEKRWLEDMIAALEAAPRSSAPWLVKALVIGLHNSASGGWTVNLAPEKKAELARLASRICRAAARRRPARDPGPRLVRLKARTGKEAAV